jgi:hypothetical protein
MGGLEEEKENFSHWIGTQGRIISVFLPKPRQKEGRLLN